MPVETKFYTYGRTAGFKATESHTQVVLSYGQTFDIPKDPQRSSFPQPEEQEVKQPPHEYILDMLNGVFEKNYNSYVPGSMGFGLPHIEVTFEDPKIMRPGIEKIRRNELVYAHLGDQEIDLHDNIYVPEGMGYSLGFNRNIMMNGIYIAALMKIDEAQASHEDASAAAVLLGYDMLYHMVDLSPTVIGVPVTPDVLEYFVKSVNQKIDLARRKDPSKADQLRQAAVDINKQIIDDEEKTLLIQGAQRILVWNDESGKHVIAGDDIQQYIATKYTRKMFDEYLSRLGSDTTIAEWYLPPDKWNTLGELPRSGAIIDKPNWLNVYRWLLACTRDISRNGALLRDYTMPKGEDRTRRRPRNLTEVSDAELFQKYIKSEIPFLNGPLQQEALRTYTSNEGDSIVVDENREMFQVNNAFRAQMAQIENRKKELIAQFVSDL